MEKTPASKTGGRTDEGAEMPRDGRHSKTERPQGRGRGWRSHRDPTGDKTQRVGPRQPVTETPRRKMRRADADTLRAEGEGGRESGTQAAEGLMEPTQAETVPQLPAPFPPAARPGREPKRSQ